MQDRIASFTKAFFGALDGRKLPYCVERNYEKYPDRISGDIDLVMLPEDFGVGIEAIKEVARDQNGRLFVLYHSSHAVHAGVILDCYPERFIIVIEFFAGGVWRGLTFLEPREILDQRIRYSCCWRPASEDEFLITFVHHLLYNSQVFPKYRERLLRLYSENPDACEKKLAGLIGSGPAARLCACVDNENWSAIEATAGQFRKNFIFRKMLRQPFRSFTGILRLRKYLRRKPLGLFVAMSGEQSADLKKLADELMEIVARWHIFLPPRREIIECENCEQVYSRINGITQSGGIALGLNAQDHDIDPSKVEGHFADVRIKDGIARVKIKAKELQSIQDDEMPMFIWNSILSVIADSEV